MTAREFASVHIWPIAWLALSLIYLDATQAFIAWCNRTEFH